MLAKLPWRPEGGDAEDARRDGPSRRRRLLTDTDRQWAQRFGVTPEAMERAAKRDRERASARGLADTE